MNSPAVSWAQLIRANFLRTMLAASALGALAGPGRAQTVEWVRQLGTAGSDNAVGVSADGLGNVYISGVTGGSLGGPFAGFFDAFVAKYDAAGVLQWTRQLGTTSYDSNGGVSADGLGNVYISGITEGSLGGPNAGASDAFVAKYNAAGTLQWTRQFGTGDYDSSSGVSADGLGNVFVSGSTSGDLGGPNAGGDDAFVSKYDSAGTLLWTRQLGTASGDSSTGVSADGLGNVYISGTTSGNLGGPNAGGSGGFVAKYDSAGALLWTRQLGTASNNSNSVSADGLGNVYISGQTGDLQQSNKYDGFVAKIADSGLPGDFNHDGAVDGGDFLAWQRGESPDSLSAADLAIWKSNFGPAASAAISPSTSVPEPSALALAAPALALLAAATLGRVPPRREISESRRDSATVGQFLRNCRSESRRDSATCTNRRHPG